MIWTLHSKPGLTGPRLAEGLVAVPERLATWALLFPAFWLAWHQLWLGLIAYVIYVGTLLALLPTPYLWVTLAIFGLPGLYLWLEGHQLVRARLDRQGYALVGIIEAPDEQVAVARHLAQQPFLTAEPEPRSPLPDRPAQTQPETFGLFGA